MADGETVRERKGEQWSDEAYTRPERPWLTRRTWLWTAVLTVGTLALTFGQAGVPAVGIVELAALIGGQALLWFVVVAGVGWLRHRRGGM